MEDRRAADSRALLRDRIVHWTAQNYRVVSETPTSAQLVRPKRFNAAEFLAMPIYLLEYLGQREQQVYISIDTSGMLTETGSGTQVSGYRKAQQQSASTRPLIALGALALLVVILLVLGEVFR